MRIALLTPGGVDRSGTDRVIPCLLWLIERLARDNDVQVFAWSQEPQPGHWPLLGAQVHNAGRRPHGLRILRMIAAEQRRRRFDLIHAFWAYPCGLVGAAASRFLGIPLVVTLPGGDIARIQSIGYGGQLSRKGRTALQVATSSAATVTVPSLAMLAQAEAAGISARYVPLGVATDRWPPLLPRRRQPGALLRLLHVASLNRVKDQTTLLSAASHLAREGVDFEMDVVGCDTLGGEMQRLTAELGLGSSIHFRGFVPHHELRRYYERADILVLSSIHDCAPVVVLEAAVAGIPCVGTCVGHVADFAPRAALAVPIQDAAALAREISRLATDEAYRLELADAAQRRALAIDADASAAAYRAVYDEVLGRTAQGTAPLVNAGRASSPAS